MSGWVESVTVFHDPFTPVGFIFFEYKKRPKSEDWRVIRAKLYLTLGSVTLEFAVKYRNEFVGQTTAIVL